MRGIARDLMIYVLIQTIFISALSLLGESRIDAYISISILIYFVSTTILPNIRKYSNLRIVDIILIVLFGLIVTLRVLEILGYRIPVVSP